MPFTAPGYTVGEPSVNGLGSGQQEGQSGAPGVSATPPIATVDANIAADQEKAILAQLNRPGWQVVSKSPPGSDGSQQWVIAGPNGQDDTMIVGANGSVIAPPTKTPEKPTASDIKPSPPDKWVTITDGNGNPIARQDPATGKSLDIAKPPAARVDTPAETQNAATNASRSATEAAAASQNANTASAAQSETARHNQSTENSANALQTAQAARDTADANYRTADLAYKSRLAEIDAQYKDGSLTEQAAKNEIDKAHFERQDAANLLTIANQRFTDENNASFQQGQLSNQQTQNENQSAANAENTRSHQATEAQAASNAEDQRNATSLTALNAQMHEEQVARDAAAQRGAGLLKDRATIAEGTNNAMFQGAAGAKNYGLGSTADVSQLPQAAQGWATDMMGGQPLFDQAVKQVHDANPALSGTPQGAAYASLLAQVMGKKAQADAGGLVAPGSAPTPTDAGSSLAPPGVAGAVSPSDPRFLGTVIGAAVQHIAPEFAQSDIHEGTSRGFTAP